MIDLRDVISVFVEYLTHPSRLMYCFYMILHFLHISALAEVNERPIYNPEAPTDFYTDGSYTDNGKPFAAAGWGVHVINSDRLGECFGAVPGQV